MIKQNSSKKTTKQSKVTLNNDKKNAILVGIFILVAYGVLINALTESSIIVMLADVISGLAVMGIAIVLYPYFKSTHKTISLSYLSLKIVEGALMIAGGFIFLNSSLHDLRNLIYEDIHVYVFIISGFLLYYLFYKSELIPRFLSLWGILAISTLSIRTILNAIGISIVLVDFLLILIISNEVFLAVWLMIKGFHLPGSNQVQTQND